MNTEQLTEKVMELEKDSAAQHEQLKSMFSRLDKQDAIIESLRALTSTIGPLAESQARIETTINNTTTDVDELKAKPGKRWEAVVGYVLAAVVSGVIGFMLRGL